MPCSFLGIGASYFEIDNKRITINTTLITRMTASVSSTKVDPSAQHVELPECGYGWLFKNLYNHS